MPEATTTAEMYHRHGEADSSQWDEAQAVTGRPNDTPIRDDEDAPHGGNSTFASRAKREKPKAKAMAAADAENKAVRKAATKARK